MGREIVRLIGEADGMEVAARVDVSGGEGIITDIALSPEADMMIDFSHHSAISGLMVYATERRIPSVIATTGHTDEERAIIAKASEVIPVFYTANMSMGVAVLCSLAKQAAAAFPDADIEIVETHHNRKLDAPSGTALMLANSIRQARPGSSVTCGRSGMCKREHGEIGIQSVRLGNVVGIHEVFISTGTQTIAIKHEAHSRTLFSEGAVAAARFLAGKPAGLYDMHSIVD